METHPFGSFVPDNTKYLLVGSFTCKEAHGWFYGTKRNQFWPILRSVYNLPLDSTSAKQDLFIKLGMAITDIIYQCERSKGTNLDSNLINIVWNIPGIQKIFSQNKIEKIYFSSRFVEIKFKRFFSTKAELITLPSPSPRYAKLSLPQKTEVCRQLLPA